MQLKIISQLYSPLFPCAMQSCWKDLMHPASCAKGLKPILSSRHFGRSCQTKKCSQKEESHKIITYYMNKDSLEKYMSVFVPFSLTKFLSILHGNLIQFALYGKVLNVECQRVLQQLNCGQEKVNESSHKTLIPKTEAVYIQIMQ